MQRQQKFFSQSKNAQPLTGIPNLVENQLTSFDWFVKDGIKEVFDEFSPIPDYSGKKFDLEFLSSEVGAPKYDEEYAKTHELTYEAPLRVVVKLTNKTLGSSKEQELFMADVPIMTQHGTFITNGVERVVVPQLARSFGMLFTDDMHRGKRYFGAKIIPSRGAWVEIQQDTDGTLVARIDRKRKFPASSLLRALTDKKDEDILKMFEKEEAIPADIRPKVLEVMKQTFAADPAETRDDSFIEIHRRLRDGEMATAHNARDFIESIFSREKYDLSVVGRFRFNKRFGKDISKKALEERSISVSDLVIIFSHIIELAHTPGASGDNIDHLGSRRVRFVGEMLQQKVRVGMTQMKRNIQDRMSTIESDTTLPTAFISPRPLQARIKEFYTTNQLSQLMSQENLLSELEHLRTLSALGPGGLTRERAGLEVRDVHPSHYGRVCPIHTPEGPNIGLILHLSVYARINEFGMIETPYAKVEKGVISQKIEYLNALEEEKFTIAHGATPRDEKGRITSEFVQIRRQGQPALVSADEVEYIDIAANQPFSVATSLIPFLEHNDANRALMGSNMQKQSVPCVLPEAPLVATGMEEQAARDTGRVVLAREGGVVKEVDARHILINSPKGGDQEYRLTAFERSNLFTAMHQRPLVSVGERVKKGQPIADASTTEGGQLALGQNALVAFMTFDGSNYEDAIIISERLVRKSKFSSIKIDEFIVNVRDTKLGSEVTTYDIPNVGEAKLKNLDEEGVVRIGAEVGPGDILLGKITPKGETELTPEERLLRSIFGEKARDVKDTSLRVPNGKKGRIIGVRVFSRERGDTLESGVIKRIHIELATLRNISVGDKLAGRHGNKGVISRILPEEEMPYMDDGTPVDIILTPLGVPSRMNLGQIMEMHLGLAARTLNYQAISPAFLGVSEGEIREELSEAGFEPHGKVKLRDGRTGDYFDKDIAVGCMYMLKLNHMVQDKIHMRSIGPYSLITQQPLGGKAQGGGQRFGEMEVWALEGYGAAHALREMLTIKSDDIVGRTATFDSLVKGEPLQAPNIPASFSVLLNNLKGLALNVELHRTDDK